MNFSNKEHMDLFIFRRKEKKIDLPLLKSNRIYIQIGLLIGGSFVLFVLLISLILTFQIVFNKVRKNNLKPFVEEYDNYVLKINKLNKKVSTLNKTNSELTQAILSIRSGSSILSEISRLIPSQIALTKLNVQENKLEIKGIVDQSNGLELVNVFIIELNNSKFIVDNSVKLINAKDKNENSNFDNDFIDFSIDAEIIKDAKIINKEKLKELGSIGLFKRVELIQSKGLFK